MSNPKAYTIPAAAKRLGISRGRAYQLLRESVLVEYSGRIEGEIILVTAASVEAEAERRGIE